MAETKRFHLGEVLSVTTGYLLSPDGIDGVYRILNWMTRDKLFTHQLPRAARECAPFLRRCFPALAAISPPDRLKGQPQREAWMAWLGELVKQHGEEFEVPRLPSDIHDFKNPIQELEEMVGKDRVIVVKPPEEE